jgi:hypothetical protein
MTARLAVPAARFSAAGPAMAGHRNRPQPGHSRAGIAALPVQGGRLGGRSLRPSTSDPTEGARDSAFRIRQGACAASIRLMSG